MPLIELTQQQITVDTDISETSTNPVQNCAIAEALADKADDDRVTEIENKLTWIDLE